MTKDSGEFWRGVKAAAVVILTAYYARVLDAGWPPLTQYGASVLLGSCAILLLLDLTSPTQEDNSHE